MTLPESPAVLKSSVIAAVFLWALSHLQTRGEWPRTVADVLALTGAGRSQAYEMLSRLEPVLDDLKEPPAAPATAPDPAEATRIVLRAVRDFLMNHPGAVAGEGARRRYADGFRHFVIDLRARGAAGADLTVEQLADATGVPEGTIKDWLRLPQPPVDVPAILSEPPAKTEVPGLTASPEIAIVLTEWERWEGTFIDFCAFLKRDHRLPYGPTFINSVLQAAGRRAPTRRGRRDPPWSRGTFTIHFPGAQWIGDGMALVVRVNEHRYAFNLEAIVDPASDAVVGAIVTDTEDEQAVLKTFDNGLTSASGAPPLALTLDNRPSNLTTDIEKTIAPTVLMPATPGRGQAKAPCEGHFGLFQQSLPPLDINGRSERELARSSAQLIATAWARGRNGRPRRRLGGRSPADAYLAAKPSPEDVAAARAHIAELKHRADRARRSREARADPVRRTLLAEAFERLAIADPAGRLAIALANYGLDAIQRGLATFETKKYRGTLPSDADHGRYLGGIIRNLDTRFELERMSECLLDIRLRARDLQLAPLADQAERLRVQFPPQERPAVFTDYALKTTPLIDFRFWSRQAARALGAFPPTHARDCYRKLARHIAAAFSTDRDRRADLIDRLASAIA